MTTTISKVSTGTHGIEQTKLLLETCVWVRERGGSFSISTAYTDQMGVNIYTINWPEKCITENKR